VDEPSVWAVVRSGSSPTVVNLPDLDQWAEPAAIAYLHP